MTQDFINYLMQRPHHYLLAWCRIYAMLENGTAEIPHRELARWAGTSRSTLQRIIAYGASFEGNTMAASYAGGKLVVTDQKKKALRVIKKDVAKKAASQRPPSPQKVKHAPKANGHTTEVVPQSDVTIIGLKERRGEAMRIYEEFLAKNFHQKRKVKPTDDHHMDAIVHHLEESYTLRPMNMTVDEYVRDSLRQIFNKWDSLSGYLQRRIALENISKDIVEITAAIIVAHKPKKGKTQTEYDQRLAEMAVMADLNIRSNT